MRCLIEAANARIAVAEGRITESSGPFDVVLRLPDGEVHSGLINAHDHLHRNHYDRLGMPPYANAYDWARDIQARYAETIARGREMPRRQALLHGAWKNLLAGVTHVVHHDTWEPDFDDNFPIHVVPLASVDSVAMSPDFVPPARGAFALHVAEGVDGGAAAEVKLLAERGLLNEWLIAVHAVGPDADGIAALRASGAALVWCPSSNHFLLGHTAPSALLAEGIDILLGSDSRLTGAGDLLDELRFARGLGALPGTRLLDAVGATAARRLGLPPPGLAIGAEANLAVFRKPLLEAAANDVALVMAAGELRVLDPGLLCAGISHGCIYENNGVARWISGF